MNARQERRMTERLVEEAGLALTVRGGDVGDHTAGVRNLRRRRLLRRKQGFVSEWNGWTTYGIEGPGARPCHLTYLCGLETAGVCVRLLCSQVERMLDKVSVCG